MRLVAEGAALQTSASQLRDDADGVSAAAGLVVQECAYAAGAAGHAHVRSGLDRVADYHGRYLVLLAMAAEALAAEVVDFDACMARVDRDLAAGR